MHAQHRLEGRLAGGQGGGAPGLHEGSPRAGGAALDVTRSLARSQGEQASPHGGHQAFGRARITLRAGREPHTCSRRGAGQGRAPAIEDEVELAVALRFGARGTGLFQGAIAALQGRTRRLGQGRHEDIVVERALRARGLARVALVPLG